MLHITVIEDEFKFTGYDIERVVTSYFYKKI